MVWQRIRMVLLAGLAVAVLALPTRADDPPKAADQKDGPGALKPPEMVPAPQNPAPVVATSSGDCGQQYRTVCVTEWVNETVPCTRTVYKTEYKTETYTAYRCESVPEQRTRTCVVNRMVCETKDVVRNVCVKVPVTEERICMETFVTCRPVTKTVTKCVDRGHYECREVPCEESWASKTRKKLCGKRHKSDCCETSCSSDCGDSCCAPPMKTVRVWVPCMVTEQCQVTCNERVCEQRPVKRCVTTCRTEVRQEVCKVTCYRCVPETKIETYCCMVSRMVPYQATRCCAVCVPCTETVNVTRCVPHTVVKQVAVDTCCASSCDTCGGGCGAACCSHEKHHKSRGGRMGHHKSSSCCD